MDIVNQDIIIGNMCICTGTLEMTAPKEGAAIRQASVLLRNFVSTPSVTANITGHDGNGSIFSIYDIANVMGAQTEVKFTAANVQGDAKSDATYYCSYVVTGQIA